MKKASIIILLLSLFSVSSCGNNNFNINSFEQNEINGELSDFNLLSPIDDNYQMTPTFTWEQSENATSYILEIASTEQFITVLDTEIYYKKTNISTTSFTIQSNLSKKNQTYYWKVTAVNGKQTKLCNEVKSFYLSSQDNEEVKFDLGTQDDWALHQLGSYADVNIDNSNFFDNNLPSLVVSFKKEDTNQGIVSKDGWIILTRTIEKDIYGPDSLYLNFYYSGNDANLIIRLVDKDNEYYYHPIQISNNAKQGVILRFSDFIQRINDVTVANRQFNFEHIKYFEIVFERSFGDGTCLINDVKAVKFKNYQNLFVDKLNFNSFDENDIVFENYNFGLNINEYEFNTSYSNAKNENNDKGINGYGFTKFTLNRYFMPGDSVKFKVKYNGTKGTNILFRIYEQDQDRWSFKLPFSSIIENEYYEIVIPYVALMKSSIQGDGAKQLYYILNLQFGLEGIYGTGSLSFKDFEIVYKENEIDTSEKIINEDGIIDDFDNYNNNAEPSYIWKLSSQNKDELMTIENSDKPSSSKNSIALYYKADMGPAIYTLPISSTKQNFDGISICIKDKSIKNQLSVYSHLENVHPDFAVVITLKSGEEYRYMINGLSSFWNEFNIPFAEFKLASEDIANPLDITIEGIKYISVAMQYFYKDNNNNPLPCYMSDNVVLIDNLKFINNSTLSTTLLEKVISPSKDDPNIAIIDDFEYDSNNTINKSWYNALSQDYGQISLSDDVSTKGNNHSMKINYVGNSASPKIVRDLTISSLVKGKALSVDLKGDDKATIYINIYLSSGANSYQYRYTLNNVASSWNNYLIGFNNFELVSSSSGMTLSSSNIIYVSKITFGVVNYIDNLESNIYIDNLLFNANVGYLTNTVTSL